MMKKLLILIALALIMMNINSIAMNSNAEQMAVPYTIADRDRIIRMEANTEQMVKRMDDQRVDDNRRFEELRTDEKRRFEEQQVNTKEQFDTIKIAFGMVISILIGLQLFLINIVIRERRTLIAPIEKKLTEIDLDLKEIKKESSFGKVISVFRELAKSNPQIADVLKNNNIL